MKLKVRYENEFQTIELDAKSMDEMWVSLSLEDGENLTQEEKENMIQDAFEEINHEPWNQSAYAVWSEIHERADAS